MTFDLILNFLQKMAMRKNNKMMTVLLMKKLSRRAQLSGIILTLKKFTLQIFTQDKICQNKKFLKKNYCMYLQVQELNFLWIEFHSISIVTLNAKCSMYSQNTNTWFSRIILKIWPLIQKGNLIIFHLKRLPIFLKE